MRERKEMEVRPVQPSKAWSPIEVTNLGIVTFFNFVWLYAIYSGIDFTSSPITRLVSGQSLNHLSLSLLGDAQFSALKVTEVRLVQPEKALPPIEVIELGIEIEVRNQSFWKASESIRITLYVLPEYFTLLGMVT